MSDLEQQPVTQLLQSLARREPAADERLAERLYAELRAVAERELARAAPGQSLHTTALVHEAFVRLVGERDRGFENRRHFFFAAARAMHDILVERARSRATLRRGGAFKSVDLDGLELACESPPDELLALEEALERLGADDPHKRRIVELRFFGGLSAEETALAMGMSLRTLEREWSYIRARLYRDLREARDREPGPTS